VHSWITLLRNFVCKQKESRRLFIDAVYKVSDLSDDSSLYLPYNLWDGVFLKEIEDWIKDEPYNPIPYKWSGDFQLMKKSLELDPTDQQGLARFGANLVSKINMNQHEIHAGFGYSGDPVSDIQDIQFFKPFLKNIENPELRRSFTVELEELESCALQFI